jgi:hypothetical protein
LMKLMASSLMRLVNCTSMLLMLCTTCKE